LQPKSYICKILEIEGATNVRDLGGYKARGGSSTSYGRFLRSGGLSKLSEKGIQQLLAAGVDCIIDLRSRSEVEKLPSAIGKMHGIDVYHIPMLDFIQSEIAQGTIKLPDTLEEIYLHIIEKGQEDFRRVFEVFAMDYRCILFHCTAGKDRTGMSAMLLLTLAGVDKETILEDYSYSYELNCITEVKGVPTSLLESNKSTLAYAIELLERDYGGGVEYIKAAGVTAAQISAICGKLGVSDL